MNHGHFWLYQFLRNAVINYHKLSGLKQQKFILSQFSRLEVCNTGFGRAILACLFCLSLSVSFSFSLSSSPPSLPLLQGRILPCPFLASSGGFQQSLAVDMSIQCLLFGLLHGGGGGVCVFLQGHQPHWIRTHLNPVWPHFNLNTSATTLFPNKITFTVYGSRGRDFSIFLRGTQFSL